MDPGRGNPLTVLCDDAEIDAFVNGHHVARVTDSTVARRRVGFYAYSLDYPYAVRFDNVLLTTPGRRP